MDTIIKLLEQLNVPPAMLLNIAVFLGIAIWFYREMKTGWIDNRDRTVTRLDKTLEIYGKLENTILLLLRSKEQDPTDKPLLEIISQSYPYISDDLYGQLNTYIITLNVEQLAFCLGTIQKEIPQMRLKYLGKVVNVHDNFEHHFSIIGIIKRTLTPVSITIISATTTYILYMIFKTISEQSSVFVKITSACSFLLVLFSLFLGYIVYRDNEIRKNGSWYIKLFPIYIFGDALLKNWAVEIGVFVILTVMLSYFQKRKQRRFQPTKGVYY